MYTSFSSITSFIGKVIEVNLSKRLPKVSRSDVVYDYLQQQILSLTLKPKEKISESQICKETGASRTPVREAIGQLVHEGLLLVYPQRGTFVAPIDVNAFLEAHFVRTAIEIAILKKAVLVWQPELTAEALAHLQFQQRAIEEQDYDSFYQHDHQFHHIFAKAAGMTGVTNYIDQTRVQLLRVRSLVVQKEGHMESVVTEHKAILNAIESGDIDQAVSALQYHLDTLYTTLAQLQRDHASFFTED